MIRLYIISIALFLGAFAPHSLFAQCQEVIDNEGIATSNPTWYNCSAANVPLSIETSTSWADLVIDWGDGSATEAIGAFNPGDAPMTHTYAGDASSYTLTLAEADGSCSIEGHYFASAPVSDFWSSEVSVCEGTSVQFHQEATGVQYAWNFGVNPNFLNTSTGHVSFTFSNPGEYTVQSVIQFPGTNGACADTSSLDITILPRPEVSMNLSANEGCGEVTVTGDVSAADSYLYVWSFMPSPSFQVGTQLDPITFNSPGNHPISVAVTGINGCQSTAQQFVTVHPQPEAEFAFDGVCFGETTAFSDESIAGFNTNITGWYWQFGDGGVSYESNPSHDYAFTGDYNVSLTVTTPECTASTSQFVGINPNPTVEAQADILSGCSPLEVAFNADASLASTFAWEIDGNAFNGVSVDATLETAIGDASVHTATITVTSAQGCSATDDITVEAFPRAIAQIDPTANAGCAPYTLPIANLSEGAIAYEWYANGNFVTSSADWSGTLENINNAIESQTVELVAHSVEGCNDTTATTIQVYPEADFTFNLPNDTACSPLELTMPMMEGVNSFTWNFGGGNTSDEQAPSILLENTNGGLMGTSITFTGVSVFGCVDSHTETVYVRPQPVAEFSSDALEGCEPLAANFENISSDADSYFWDFGNGITDDGPTASQAFYTDGTVQTYDITLTAYDDLGCTDTDTLTVTVFPAADFILDLGVETACSPLEMTLPVIAGAQNVAWDFGDGTTSNEATPNYAWENTTGGLDNYIVSVTGETEHGCAGLAVDLITVKPQPTAAFNADALSGCEPLDAAFTSTSTAGTDLSWNFGDGTSVSGSYVNHTFDGIDSNTAFDVTLTATHPLGCADVATATVDVFAAAEYALNLSADSVCSPLELTMPEIAGAQNFTWNFGDGTTSNEATPTHTWFNASTGLMTATVTLEAETADGCAGTSQATVNIKPQPVANFMVANDEGCDPLVSQFNNYSVLADSYDWDFGDGTTGHEEHPAHAFAANSATTTYAVTLTAHDDLGCSDATTRDVTVHPAAAFSLNLASDTVCSPLQLTLPAIPGAENLTWNFGDGTTGAGQTPTHTWENTGDDLMEATVSFEAATTNGCVGSGSATVYIKPQPQADFTASVESGCAPLSVAFNNMSTQADAFAWDFGNGTSTTAPNATADFDAIGTEATYTVTLTATDDLGCTSTATREITAFPAANFALDLPADSACSPLALTLPVIDGAQALTWNFGDGNTTTGQAPSHTWENTTNELMTTAVSFTAETEHGCAGSATALVHVKPQPQAIFTIDEENGCAPLSIEISNESQLADAYDWTYGNGDALELASAGTHVYTYVGEQEPMDYTLTLTATHALGCADAVTKTVTVLPAVNAAWAGETIGCAPFETVIEYTGSDAAAIEWTLDGTAAASGNEVTFTLDGAEGTSTAHTIEIEAVSEYGCAGTAAFEVTVNPTPLVNLSASSNATCSGDAWNVVHDAQYADNITLTMNGMGLDLASDLSFNSVNPSATDATSTLVLTASTDQGCSATMAIEHTVHPQVTANFDLPMSACTPMEVAFNNTSVQATASTTWNFGDGTTSDALNPAHTFEALGTEDVQYNVTLVAVNAAGCADTTVQVIEVWGQPEAALTVVEAEGCYPVDVTFENASAGHAATAWSYGNGEYSAIADSVHTKTFFNPTDELVVYTTEITVSNAHGCTSTNAVDVEVGPHLNAQFDVVAQGCAPVDANIINQSEGAASFIWNFNDGSAPSNEVNPTHTFVNATGEDVTYEVELIAMSTYGCADTTVVGVEVYAVPTAEFTVSPAIQTYPNTTVGITNLSTASSSAIQHWSFGDGAELASDQPIFHTYNSWGTYNVTLLIDNGFCADAHTEVITILSPNPVASFTGSGSGCAPLAVDFDNHSSHGAQYIWDFDDDVMTSEESPTHVFTRPGVYNVSLTVIGYEGQEDQVIQYGAVEVFPSASAAFVNSPTEVIVPDQPVDFVNLSEMDATEFFWDFGDGQFSTEKEPVHFYTEPGIYTVSLTANNSFNCPTTYTLEHAVEATVGGFMEFPTAFTPNTGGSNGGYYDPNALDNDVFHPHHMGIVDYELIIFNKWGELIFRSTDPYIGWDGYFQGRIVRQDVYAWKATATFSSGYRTTQAGDVTLIK
jgi:PKD repeat protein